ncbi:unnamed protein product [Sympodiomycopsis kandeliae]
MTTAPKAQLYSFPGSVWASVPRLALIEKGYHAEDVEIKTVDLAKGENFAPAFIRINPKATLPTLVVPLAGTITDEVDTKFRAINGAHSVIEFLDQSRNAQLLDARGESGKANPAPMLGPATIEAKAKADKLIELLHAENVDPNTLLLSARTVEELSTQRKGFQGSFVKARLEAINKYRAETVSSSGSTENPRTQQQSAALVKWYDEKLVSLTPLIKVYIESDSSYSEQFISHGIHAWQQVGKLITALEETIETPYILGGQISLVDLHLGAWFARVQAVAKGLYPDVKDPLQALERALTWQGLGEHGQAQIGPKLRAYWAQLMERPSFQEVYKDGPH